MEDNSVKRYPLSKQVSDKLEAMIESGDYKVGEKIPTEPQLMEIFQVSRNTIREAVKSLTWAGVLEVKQGDGTYVRSSDRFDANMKQKYAQVSLKDIAEARNSIEVTISRIAAIRRNEDDIEQIAEALRKRKGLKENIKENTKADIDFHMCIAEASHNTILIDLYRSISYYLEEQIAERHMVSKLKVEEIDELHEKLFLAIKEGKPDMAEMSSRDILDI